MLCSLFMMVILLNLFIAIVSNAFEKINSQKERAMFAEKAAIIADNLYLVDEDSRSHWIKKDKFLIFVEDLGDDDDADIPIEVRLTK